ncbi:MAG: ABC transporter substrate-binding protein, partial [Acidimicrobiia bacterium]|nr:ABC transporter substrate-binding protein [Acidimicrobiia bacterium]
DGSVWTFPLRTEATWMADGAPFTSTDVKATMNRLVESGNSALDGVITMDAVDDSDPAVAVFNLEAPNGNFPYLVSMFNAQSVITPESYEVGSALEVTPNGTGAWKLANYDQATGCTFERNPDWWGGTTPLDGVEFQFFDDVGSQVTAVQGGAVDGITQFSVLGGDALLNDPNFNVIAVQAATHRQIWMRCDTGQFADPRIRRALAFTFNREQMIQTLFQGRADIGNDHVIAPFLPYYDDSVPQRTRDIEQAQALLAEAGVEGGFQATLHCGELQEIPQLAQLIQAGAAEAGFDLQIEVEGLDTFYGAQWCPPGDDGQPTDPPCNRAAELGIVDYGHRPTPDIYLNAALSTGGVWNSSQYANPEFDAAFAEYSQALGVDEQKAAVNKIETILNEDVPVGVPFFYNYLAGHSNEFQGVLQSALGHPVFTQASRV